MPAEHNNPMGSLFLVVIISCTDQLVLTELFTENLFCLYQHAISLADILRIFR